MMKKLGTFREFLEESRKSNEYGLDIEGQLIDLSIKMALLIAENLKNLFLSRKHFYQLNQMFFLNIWCMKITGQKKGSSACILHHKAHVKYQPLKVMMTSIV